MPGTFKYEATLAQAIMKAIITGASSGLGHEIARTLLEEKVAVVNVSRSPSKLKLENVPTDLTKNDNIEKAVKEIKELHADAALLVLCSGVLHWRPIGENSQELIDHDIGVNLAGVMKFADGILPLIEKNHGDVIVIGSTSAFNIYPGSAVYTAAKHGVLGYIKALQAEYKKKDVRILGIHPGGFKSNLHIKAESAIDPEKLMEPKDLAELILHLTKLPRNMEVSEIIINRKNPC